MRKGKIDRKELVEMVKKGLSQHEIAQHFGCSDAAVFKARRKLKIACTKNTVLESAPAIMESGLDAFSQINKINVYANEMLDLLIRWQKGDGDALRVMEQQVSKKKIRVGDKELTLDYAKIKDPRELTILLMREIRGQIQTQAQLLSTLYDVKAVAQFQQTVIDIIGSVSPEARKEILFRLNQQNAIRASVEIRG